MSNQVYSNYTTQYPVTGEIITNDIHAITISTQQLTANTFVLNNPTLNNALSTPLIYNFATSDVEYATNMATTDTVQTLTNKTIDSDDNSIIIGATNINSLINQDVRNSASPIFASLQIAPIPFTQEVTISKTDAGACLLNIEGGGIMTIKDGVYDVVGNTLTQTLTNKTIDSDDNSIIIGATNVNSLINQDVRTTASPTLATLTLTTGILLPTTGGTPSTLNYYEYYTEATTMSGPWAASQNLTLIIERLGNKVTIGVAKTTSTTNSINPITVAYALPSRLWPTTQIEAQFSVINGGSVNANGLIEISTAGVIKFYQSVSKSGFSSGGLGGPNGATAVYFTTQ